MDPILICVAPNGARKTTNDHSALPVTSEALALEAKSCMEAGAAIIHLHVRDDKQAHTLDIPTYKRAIDAIYKECGKENMIIQATSEAVGVYTAEQQMKMVINLRPQAVSLAIREIIPTSSYRETARMFLKDVLKQGTMPQYILYSPEEVKLFAEMRKEGIIPGKKVSVLFVLGKKQGNPEKSSDAWAVPEDLDPFLECFETDLKLSETIWSVCAFGGREQEIMEYVIKCGGHVRIGFENNHLMPDGSKAPSNSALIKQFSNSLSETSRRKIFTAEEASDFLKPTLEIN